MRRAIVVSLALIAAVLSAQTEDPIAAEYVALSRVSPVVVEPPIAGTTLGDGLADTLNRAKDAPAHIEAIRADIAVRAGANAQAALAERKAAEEAARAEAEAHAAWHAEQDAVVVQARQRVRTERRAVPERRGRPAPTPVETGTGRCGGDLPPCSVMQCESGGNIRAQNPTSSASGKWQIISSTWGGYGGYARASDAPEHVQDERARQIYAGGAGRSAWVC